MPLTKPGNTQVYSPFGSYVVEQHAGTEPERTPEPEQSGLIEVKPSFGKGGGPSPLSQDQAAIGHALKRYYEPRGAAPERFRSLLDTLERKTRSAA